MRKQPTGEPGLICTKGRRDFEAECFHLIQFNVLVNKLRTFLKTVEVNKVY